MNIEGEPQKKTKNSSSRPSFSSLPEEIVETCLARISRSYYPTLSTVSKAFKSILSSTELYSYRSQMELTEQCLYVCIIEYNNSTFLHLLRLWINPNKTLTKTIRNSLVPVPPCIFPTPWNTTITVGSEIYVISKRIINTEPSSVVRVLDCRTHTWRDAPSMNEHRLVPSTCVYNRKIYVFGRYEELKDDEPWAEVFDTKTQTWEQLPNPGSEVRMNVIHRIVEIDGKIKFGYIDKMYCYDTKQGKWECCENESAMFPRPADCVLENVPYRYSNFVESMFKWYDIKDEDWKGVKGLDSLRNKYELKDCFIYKLVSCGGKLLFIWEERCINWHPSYMKKLWCAEILMEHRYGGEVWGIVEWCDVVHTIPASCSFLHCLTVSV